jgi:small GTP-binding protein
MTGVIPCKVVLLGNSAVGKTSIVTRWMTGTYQHLANPTIGANQQRKRVPVDGTEVDLQLWDTAGQEQFESLVPLYARSASAVILTASITDRSSFENLSHWKEMLSPTSGDLPPIVIAANKIDLRASAEITDDEIETEYGGGRFAGLFFVSALTGEGIENLFLFAGQVAYRFAIGNKAPAESAFGARNTDGQRCC